MHAFWLVLTSDLLEDRRVDDVIIKTFFPYILIFYYIKQIDSNLLLVKRQRILPDKTFMYSHWLFAG